MFWEGVYCGLRKDRSTLGYRDHYKSGALPLAETVSYMAKVIVCSKSCNELEVFGSL